MDRGFGRTRGVALVKVNSAAIEKERRVKQARAIGSKKWCLAPGFEKLQWLSSAPLRSGYAARLERGFLGRLLAPLILRICWQS